MKVIYDATLFLGGTPGGAARYFSELARRLASSAQPDAVSVSLVGLYCAALPHDAFAGAAMWGGRVPAFPGSDTVYKFLNDTMLGLHVASKAGSDTIVHETWYGTPRLHNRRVKRVITIHDMIPEDYLGDTTSRRARAKRRSIELADGIIFVSNATRSAFRTRFSQRCAEAVIPHGCELRLTRPRQRPALDWPYLLFVGRRDGYKNWSGLIRALGRSSLLRTHGLVNAGGPLTPAEVGLLAESGVAQDRVLTMRCDDDRLADLYAHADCFIYPSLAEGFGIPLLEAASLGCPVACTDMPVFREVMADTAAYFDGRFIDSISAAVEQTVTAGRDSRLTKAASDRSRGTQWAHTAAATQAFYASLLGHGLR